MKDIGKGVSTTKVQIWSDFMCPFCYIGETTLQLAIQNLGLQKEGSYVKKLDKNKCIKYFELRPLNTF